MVMPAKERPPYVMFEVRSMEDRAASVASGHWVGRDVHFVIITPQGSKDRIERVATEWLAEKRLQTDEGRFPRQWYEAYKQSYEAWKRDEEPPLDGTPIRNWPVVSPTQYKVLRDLRVLTVEDLVAANEETLGRIGPGARALKAKAEEWLLQAGSTGMRTEEITSLRTDNEALRAQVEALQLQVNQYRGLLESQNPAGISINGAEQSIFGDSHDDSRAN